MEEWHLESQVCVKDCVCVVILQYQSLPTKATDRDMSLVTSIAATDPITPSRGKERDGEGDWIWGRGI